MAASWVCGCRNLVSSHLTSGFESFAGSAGIESLGLGSGNRAERVVAGDPVSVAVGGHRDCMASPFGGFDRIERSATKRPEPGCTEGDRFIEEGISAVFDELPAFVEGLPRVGGHRPDRGRDEAGDQVWCSTSPS